MISVQVVVAENGDIASRHAAGVVCNQIGKKRHSVLLLPTGSTPLRLYELLAEMVEAGKLGFSEAITFNLDEYLGIQEGNPESYHSFMWKNFFGKIDIKKANVHIPNSNPENAEAFCREYEKKIARTGIDLAVLGIGENGHLGFNEPGTPFSSGTHVAELSKSTIKANRRFFASEKDVPKKAITAGLKTIMQAKKVMLLAFGKKKARAVKEALEGKISEKVPASILQKHRNAVFVLDTEAASLLTKTSPLPPIIGNVRLCSPFNLPKRKKIVFFSPHPDDTAISAGALVSALAENNEVIEAVMTTGHRAIDGKKNREQRIRAREQETRLAAKALGTRPVFLKCRFYDNSKEIIEADMRNIRNLLKKAKPDIVFVPQALDMHPTHALSRKTALASVPGHVELWAYETPWSLFGHGKFNAAFEFSEEAMQKKLKAIREHRSQIERTRFDIAAKNIAGFRRITIAEQFFSQLGKKPLQTQPYLELYSISKW